jgi:hypothetical protein
VIAATKLVLMSTGDLQYKAVQHSVKLSDEVRGATLERAELESTTASAICERLLKHYLALENKPNPHQAPSPAPGACDPFTSLTGRGADNFA